MNPLKPFTKVVKDPTFTQAAISTALGLSKVGKNGVLQHRRLSTPGGLVLGTALLAGDVAGSLADAKGRVTRGATRVEPNLERLISYDGTGYLKNANKVANGDTQVLKDMVQHSFKYQSHNMFGAGGADVTDLVFALHDNREG